MLICVNTSQSMATWSMSTLSLKRKRAKREVSHLLSLMIMTRSTRLSVSVESNIFVSRTHSFTVFATVKRHHVIKDKRIEVKKALSKQEMDIMKRKSDSRGTRGGGHMGGGNRPAPVWESGPGGYNSGGYGGGYGQGGCKFFVRLSSFSRYS